MVNYGKISSICSILLLILLLVAEKDAFNYDKYNSFLEIKRELITIVKQHREIAEIWVKNRTVYGNELILLKLGKKSNQAKPFIWIDAGIHAREWISIATAMYIIRKVVENPSVTENVDWYFLPVVNPDGYEYSRTKNHRSWRKNRSGCGDKNEKETCGVDLNRNFDFDWNNTQYDAHRKPTSAFYIGNSPASEIETVTVQNAILKLSKTTTNSVYITLHSYGQFWFYPYGNKRDTPDKPKNFAEIKRLADVVVKAIFDSKQNYTFTAGHAGQLLSPSSGGSEDWAKDKAGVRYAYGVELPPTKNTRNGFEFPEIEIKHVAKALWAAMDKIYDAIAPPETQTDKIVFPESV